MYEPTGPKEHRFINHVVMNKYKNMSAIFNESSLNEKNVATNGILNPLPTD